MADPQRPANGGPVPAGPSGYVIRPPQPSAAAPPASAAVPTSPAVATVAREPDVVTGLSQNQAIIGGAIMIGAAVVYFLLRGAVRSHLIANRSTMSAAGAASWSLFSFLFAVTFTVVFGLLGQFWTVPAFIIPLGVICLVTLVLFIVLYVSASRVAR